MIKHFRTASALFVFLVTFASGACADAIQGFFDPVDNSADFSWHVDSDGLLVVSVTNSSNYGGVITGFQFDLGDGGQVEHFVDVNGTRGDADWGHTTDARGCYTSDCMITGRNFWTGAGDAGIAAGGTAEFRFFGDFSNLSDIADVIVRFRQTGRHGWGRDGGWGCRYGCGPTEVPEPGTMLIFGAGLLGFGLVARRRRVGYRNSNS